MIRYLFTLVIAILFASCNSVKDKSEKPSSLSESYEATPLATKPIEHITPTGDQKQRRFWSEKYCKAHNIPIYRDTNSLFTASERETVIRRKDEVVDRALALCYMGLKAEGLGTLQLEKMDKDFRIIAKLTDEEKIYAATPLATGQQKIDALWRYESMHVMLWALSFIDSLSYPDIGCNLEIDIPIIRDFGEAKFRQKARLRSKREILEQADLILRLNWACVNAEHARMRMPGNLSWDIVIERHRSLNWLINYLNQDWDNVTTDT